MDTKIKTFDLNKTWRLTQLPLSKVPISCKWVYKIKNKSDGSVDCYKSHLVTKGYK